MENTVMLKTYEIYPHPDNPRKDIGSIDELSESIKKNGVMQNLTVIPGHYEQGQFYENGYTVLIGHRRLAASKLAGIDDVPCRIVDSMEDKEQISTMLEENMQRADLSVFEQSQGFQMMLDLGETANDIAERTGFSKSTINHRLNIAKLDQEVLKNKNEDEAFQLSLTDLYALEKIEDLETRNKILSEANNSNELVWKARNAYNEAQRDKIKKNIIEYLEGLGITKAEDKVSTEIYSNKWKVIATYSLDEETIDELETEEEKLFYFVSYREVKVICKNKVEKKEITPEEQKKKQVDNNKKIIKAKLDEIKTRKNEFVENSIRGKVRGDIIEVGKAWNLIVMLGGFISDSTICKSLTGKEKYSLSEDERDNCINKINNMVIYEQMLHVINALSGNLSDTYDYQGKFNKDVADKYLKVFELFSKYGWVLNEDEQSLFDGTSEYYVSE